VAHQVGLKLNQLI